MGLLSIFLMKEEKRRRERGMRERVESEGEHRGRGSRGERFDLRLELPLGDLPDI